MDGAAARNRFAERVARRLQEKYAEREGVDLRGYALRLSESANEVVGDREVVGLDSNSIIVLDPNRPIVFREVSAEDPENVDEFVMDRPLRDGAARKTGYILHPQDVCPEALGDREMRTRSARSRRAEASRIGEWRALV